MYNIILTLLELAQVMTWFEVNSIKIVHLKLIFIFFNIAYDFLNTPTPPITTTFGGENVIWVAYVPDTPYFAVVRTNKRRVYRNKIS